MGCFVHLATDKVFYEKFVAPKTNENLRIIKPTAESVDDLNNQEFLTWYKENFYKIFDDDDIFLPTIELASNYPNLSEFEEYESPISEINNDNLHKLIKQLIIKYQELDSTKPYKYSISSNKINIL